jgi:hypothetical protein
VKLVEAVKGGRRPGFYLSSMRTRATVVSAAADGKLRLASRGMETTHDFSRLTEEDLRALGEALGM